MKFHERLREMRKNSPLMQKDIASNIGVSVRTFQQYELGKIEPSIERLILLANIFGVTIDFLVCRDDYLSEVSFEECETDPPEHPNV